MGKKTLTAVTSLLILIILLGSVPAMAGGKADPDRYTAVTKDGVQLALKRYRPDRNARFHKWSQPIILMPCFALNFNEFDVHTPQGERYEVELPSPLASWARRDRYIKQDPLRYYCMAHYLWLQGYDVWLANYRGMGRDPFRSGGAHGYSLDDLGIYDAPAIVEKVYQITRKHPIWLGHSTGSTMAYIYLQGARYGDGNNPHVISDPALVEERNNGNGPQSLRAFIDLEGPMCPFTGNILDNDIIWMLLYWPWFLDIRPIMEPYGDTLADPVIYLGDLFWNLCKSFGLPDLGPVNIALSMNRDNLHPTVGRYIMKYAVDGMSSRTMAQFADASAHHTFREDYSNGKWRLLPPEPKDGDGYYNYSDHLYKIKLPTLLLVDSRYDITDPNDIMNFYACKTRTCYDAMVKIPDAAHLDLIYGLNAPTLVYPEIGRWLRRLCIR